MKRKALWLILSCLMTVALVLSSCAAATTEEKETPAEEEKETAEEEGKMRNVWGQTVDKPQYGGTITTRHSFEPGQADPYFSWHGNYMASGVFETLLVGDWGVDPEINDFSNYYIPLTDTKGALAESWELSPDGKTLTWHIRKGIKWHNKPPMNGREFTGADVEFAMKRQMGLGFGYTEKNPYDGRTAAIPIDGVELTDKWTVVLTSNTGFTPSHIEFMGFVSWHMAPIPPPEVLKADPDALQDWKNWVGTGPWMLTDVTEGASRTYTKNPDYWQTDERHPGMKLPFPDEFKILIIPDTATYTSAFRTGKVDFWGTNMLEEAEAMQKSNPEATMFMTWGSTSDHGSMNCTKPPFDDIRVRKAMSMAINLEELVEQYYKGYGDATAYGLFFTPIVKGFGYPFEEWPKEEQEVYIYDPEGAKALLAEAGLPSGFKFSLDITNSHDVDRWQLIKAYWADIGVECELNMLESNAVLTSRAVAGEHDMTVQGWRATGTYPIDRLGCFITDNVENYAHWSSQKYDDLVAEAMRETDYDEFQRLVCEASMEYVKGHGTLQMPTTQYFNFTQPWIRARDGRTAMGGSNYFSYYARWWIDESKR